MAGYYQPCPELDRCNQLIETYFKAGEYEKCFLGYLSLAEQGYPLAECQAGYFYSQGLGVPKDAEKAFYWSHRAALHGDRDGQYNTGCLYEAGEGVAADLDKAKRWYQKAARQGHKLAIAKCQELGVCLD